MSLTHEIVIWCDLCGCWARSLKIAPQARKKLKEQGWTSARGSIGYPPSDWCPTCSKDKEAVLAGYKSGKLNAEERSKR